jgi:hypothetical protein
MSVSCPAVEVEDELFEATLPQLTRRVSNRLQIEIDTESPT